MDQTAPSFAPPPPAIPLWKPKPPTTWRQRRRQDIEAGRLAAAGLMLFLRTCRQVRHQTLIFALSALGGVLRDFAPGRWIVFVVLVGLGFSAEAINTALEAVGTKLARQAWFGDCLALGLHHELVTSVGPGRRYLVTLPDDHQPQKRDPSVHQLKLLGSGVVFIVFLLDITAYTLMMFFPR